MKWLTFTFYWLARWLYYWVILLFAGALGGLTLFVLGGGFVTMCSGLILLLTDSLYVPGWGIDYLAAKGITIGMKWLGVVWGMGGAIVLCFIDGQRRRNRLENAKGHAPLRVREAPQLG
jgi:hypothetical protein